VIFLPPPRQLSVPEAVSLRGIVFELFDRASVRPSRHASPAEASTSTLGRRIPGASTGGKWTQLASSLARGGGRIPPSREGRIPPDIWEFLLVSANFSKC